MSSTREDSKKQRAEREVTEKERLILATLEGVAAYFEEQALGYENGICYVDDAVRAHISLCHRRARALREAIEIIARR